MTWLELLVAGFALSRLTRLVVSDSITEPLRNRIFLRFPGDETQFGDTEVTVNGTDTFGRKIGYLTRTRRDVLWVSGAWYAMQPTFLGRLLSCHWCTGLWVAFIGWGLWLVYPDVVFLFAPLALAELVGLLNDRQ